MDFISYHGSSVVVSAFANGNIYNLIIWHGSFYFNLLLIDAADYRLPAYIPLFIIKIKFNKIETSNHGIGFNIKQLMTDDGFMRSLDLSVNYIDKDQNLIDFLKVKY